MAVKQAVAIDRFDIWRVDHLEKHNPDKDSVQRGERYWVVVQASDGLESPVILAAPISSQIKKKKLPFLQTIQLDHESQIHYEQLRTVPKSKFLYKAGELSQAERKEMEIKVIIPLGLAHTSIPNIKRVRTFYVEKLADGGLRYHCRFSTINYETTFEFTDKEFIEFFTEIGRSFITEDKREMSLFLETLAGLKFVNVLISGLSRK